MHITTVIPAFKPHYLPDLLTSLHQQTRRSQRIIFSDDSPNGEYRVAFFAESLAPLRAGLNIEFIDGPRRGAYPNIQHLVEYGGPGCELLHVLLDDDVIYPAFYERHLLAHASAAISCSISRRWQANEAGLPLLGQPVPDAVAQHPQRLLSLDAGLIFMSTALECKNWLGEFSNAVFSAAAAPLLLAPSMGGVSYAGLWDLGAFLAASLHAPIAFLQDHLGYFRTGSANNSAQFFGPYMKAAHLGYAALLLGGQRIGKYSPAQMQQGLAILAGAMAQRYASQADMLAFITLLPQMAAGHELAEARFIQTWHAYLRQHGF